MARKPMVTRTIQSTKVTVLCLNIVTAEPFNETVVLSRTYKEDKVLKAVQAVFDSAEQKAVAVVKVEVLEELYGMDEADFIANATVLDPETRKALEAEEAEAEVAETTAVESKVETKVNTKSSKKTK